MVIHTFSMVVVSLDVNSHPRAHIFTAPFAYEPADQL